MVLALFLVFIIIPSISKTPDLRVPDVSGLSVAKAREKLEAKGLKVNESIKTDYTDEVEKGLISKTKPKAGEKVKKGATITMYKSLGSKSVKVEDFSGEDANKLQAKLELLGITVLIEKKTVENKKDYEGKENIVIDQSVKEGTLIEGDSITLFVPDLSETYPDFVKENWTLDEIKTWCSENSVNLTLESEENNDYDEGTIIFQSRQAGSKIVSNANLVIRVSKKKKEEPNLVPLPEEDDSTETSSDTNEDNTSEE